MKLVKNAVELKKAPDRIFISRGAFLSLYFKVFTYLYFIHFSISLIFGFFPYIRMPIR